VAQALDPAGIATRVGAHAEFGDIQICPPTFQVTDVFGISKIEDRLIIKIERIPSWPKAAFFTFSAPCSF
jgi:hypothetical protein